MVSPQFTLSSLVEEVKRIEKLTKEIHSFRLTPSLLTSLRQNAWSDSVYYGSNPAGTGFTKEAMMSVLRSDEDYLMPENNERVICAYDSALSYVEKIALTTVSPLTSDTVQKLHGILTAKVPKSRISTYRETDEPVRDPKTYSILYRPARAQDISRLMDQLLMWIVYSLKTPFFCPFIAGIVHKQIQAIRPFTDGNRRLACLLARFILLRTPYDCKGMYALEAYYAQDLKRYYAALGLTAVYQVYADHTEWLRYFSQGIILATSSLKKQLEQEVPKRNVLVLPARRLDAYQCKALDLFKLKEAVTAYEIKDLFHLKTHTARALCLQWVHDGFFEFEQSSKKKRSYKLATFSVNL